MKKADRDQGIKEINRRLDTIRPASESCGHEAKLAIAERLARVIERCETTHGLPTTRSWSLILQIEHEFKTVK